MNKSIFEEFEEKELKQDELVIFKGGRVRKDNNNDELLDNEWIITYDDTTDII